VTAIQQLARMLRTVRPLRPRQFIAEILYLVRGVGSPVRSEEAEPELSSGIPLAPFLPGPVHARWLGEGVLQLINHRADFSRGVDWSYAEGGPLWAYLLHNCDHLRDEGLTSERRAELIRDWIQNHTSGVGWDSHPTCLRILNWGKLLVFPENLALDGNFSRQIRGSLAQQADTLDAHLEVRVQGNHLLSNLLGIVFAGLLFDGPRADRWLGRSEALIREIDLQFNDDGGHEERSPMYHALLLENLLDTLNLARARLDRVPDKLIETLEEVASRALFALSVWSLPDGEISLFGDSVFGVSNRLDTLVEYAEVLGVVPARPATLGLLDSTGFARLDGGAFALIVSVAAPSPAHQPGHAHCDALAFELSCGDERVVADTGVFEYVSGERRRISRATLSHSTLEIGGLEQAEIWGAHRIGGRSRVRLVDFQPGARIEATCEAWSTPQHLHRRVFTLQEGALEIRDRLKGPPMPVCFSLPLAPGIKVRLIHDQDGRSELQMILPSGSRIRVMLPVTIEWRIEPHVYFSRFGEEEERERILGEARSFESGTWRFEFLG
jgi:uncharacterized heparinase superfamily protein